MTIDELLDMHKETCEAALVTMKKKNHDYTSGSGDPFANFRASEFLGVPAGKSILIRMLDKMKRLQTFVDRGSLEVDSEGVDDAVEDIVNYAILLKGVLQE